jgi:hypothetical protein
MSTNPEGDDAEREAILAELTAVKPGVQIEPEPDCAPPGENEYDPEDLDDLQLALVLLTGFFDRSGPGGLPQKKYLEPSEELVGRKALARLLRSEKPVDQTILLRLAAPKRRRFPPLTAGRSKGD